MKTWCLVTLSFVLFSALFFDTCSSAAFSEETASRLKRIYNEETKGFGKAALNDREENENWVREYDENDVDDHDWANDDDAANKDENDEDQSDIENEEGGKYEDEEQDTIEEEDEYEVEGKELGYLVEDDYDDDDADDYYDDDDDADDLSDKSDLAEWDEDNDEEGSFFCCCFFNRVYYKGQENYVDKLSAWFVSPLFFMVNEPQMDLLYLKIRDISAKKNTLPFFSFLPIIIAIFTIFIFQD